jgi:glyoxylase-like metal-dependent hydrolase (beta-lactamase superfamily II)
MVECAQWMAPDVLRLRANNPSPMTGTGSHCYLIFGAGGAVLVDAGPDLPAHIAQVLVALNGAALRAILITHPHLDHSGAAPALAAATGAQVYSHGPAPRYTDAGGEGVDLHHAPDHVLQGDGDLALAGLDFAVIHTPGHMQGHLCFGLRDMLFSGDHVMGWATSLVAPPHGDMAAYRASLRKMLGLGYARYLPGHGAAINDPPARLAYLQGHRAQREAQILAALAHGPASAATLAQAIYTDLAPALLPAAAQNVLAHLIELASAGRVMAAGPPDTASLYTLR